MMTAEELLRAEAERRILIKDGAYGTQIQARRLGESDFRGSRDFDRDQKGNNDLLNLTRPDVVRDIASAFAEAGADILATNSFNANRISQADYGTEDLVRAINVEAAKIVREVAESDGRRRWVAGAVGPTNKTLSLSPDVNDPGYREVDFDLVSDVYVEQIEALVEGGADFVLIETVFDTLNAKAAIHAAQRVEAGIGRRLPIMLSMTITDLSGRNLSGHGIESFWASVRHARPLSIGLNCSFGAAQLRPHIATLAGIADSLIMAYPNAGLPNDLGEYDESPQVTAAQVREWADQKIVNIVGGCCGTTPEHIAAIARAAADCQPRRPADPPRRTMLAGIEPMYLAA